MPPGRRPSSSPTVGRSLQPQDASRDGRSIFHLDVCVASLDATLAHFSSLGAQTLATVVRGGTSYRDVKFTIATVVVIGNEAEGLSEDVIARCDRSISIPWPDAANR